MTELIVTARSVSHLQTKLGICHGRMPHDVITIRHLQQVPVLEGGSESVVLCGRVLAIFIAHGVLNCLQQRMQYTVAM